MLRYCLSEALELQQGLQSFHRLYSPPIFYEMLRLRAGINVYTVFRDSHEFLNCVDVLPYLFLSLYCSPGRLLSFAELNIAEDN